MSCHGRTRSQGCGAGLRGGRLGGTSPVGAEMELGDEDAVGRMATVGSGPVSCLLSQPPRPRASLGRTERWGLLSAKPPGPKQEDTRRGEQQAGPCPPLPDSPASGTARAISQQRKLRLRDRVFSGDTRGVGPGGASMWLAAPRPPSPGGGSVVPAGRLLPTAAAPSPQSMGRQRRLCRLLPAHGSSPVPPVHGGSVVPAGCFLPTAAPPSPNQVGRQHVPAGHFLPTAFGLTSSGRGPAVPERPSLPDGGRGLWQPVGWGPAWPGPDAWVGVPRAVVGPPRSSGLPR